jgi:hypothetical protein
MPSIISHQVSLTIRKAKKSSHLRGHLGRRTNTALLTFGIHSGPGSVLPSGSIARRASYKLKRAPDAIDLVDYAAFENHNVSPS